MKKVFLKFITSILVLILAVTMCIPTHALDSTTKGTIMVNGLEPKVTVTAYKIIEVNLDKNGIPKHPIYKWVDETDNSVAKWVKKNYPTYIGEDNAVTETFEELDSALMDHPAKQTAAPIRQFQHALEQAIKNQEVTFTTTPLEKTSSNDKQITFEAFMGQYLLMAKGGKKIYTSTTASLIPEHKDNQWIIKDETPEDKSNHVMINMKSTEPTLTKHIIDPNSKESTNKNTVKIGDIVHYKLEVLIPYFPNNAKNPILIVRDQLPVGLDLTNQSEIQVYRDPECTEIINEGNDTFKITPTSRTSNTHSESFKITFSPSLLQNVNYRGVTIYITYSARVTANAYSNMTMENKVYMDYNPDPYKDEIVTKDDNKQVYTYGIKVNKVDKNGQTLSDAGFTLSKDTSNLNFIKIDDGKYRLALESESNGIQTLMTNNSGELEILGLDIGTYTLSETKAPNGYPVPNQNIIININTGANTNGSIKGSTVTVPLSLSYNYYDITNKDGTTAKASSKIEGHIVHVAVKNDKDNFTLPRTGGAGTFMFTIAGIALMAGAVLIFYYNRRKNNE